MSKRKTRADPVQKRTAGSVALWLKDGDICCPGYTRLSDCPEIQAGCLTIAELIGSMTIYLMANTEDGDIRIQNELSRMIDITPCGTMTRSQWMTGIVMTLLLYGKGNAVVLPHTYGGMLKSLEPIGAARVQFQPLANSYRDYRILIDGQPKDPEDVLHFAFNPDPLYLWKGQGVTVALRELADNLRQAQKTKAAFMKSEWKPSVIVKVDGLAPEFADPSGRQRLLDSYINPPYPGAPWIIPSEAFSVEQVRPLSLSDLAINDAVIIDKAMVAGLLGVPGFVLGVGTFKRDEWNNFVQTRVKAIAQLIQQELTRALILSPKMYLMLNYWSLLDYDMKSMSDILLAGADRGYVCGDEWRDRLHMTPAGLKEYKILENYIPADMSGKQKKLVGNE